MINEFFMPFFSGIFLENKLETSSRMFEFVYKMFGQARAAIPKQGMVAIPNQLKQKLSKTTFLFETKVSSVKNKKIILADGTELLSDFTIIATESNNLVEELEKQPTEWRSCYNLYFETSS